MNYWVFLHLIICRLCIVINLLNDWEDYNMVISKSENTNYLTKISNESTCLETDVSIEKGGNGQSFRPHDLLCSALASCMNITTRMVMDKLKITYEDVIVKVDLDRKSESTNFIYDINIIGDIPEKTKQEIIRLAENCPVRKTLSKELKFIRG